MLLLSDGSVMVQGGSGSSWYRLKPDIHGGYVNGTWTTLASMHDTRLYYSTQVLKDGRVFVAGGEYGTGASTAEVYDPMTNAWTLTPASGQRYLDSVSQILADGRVIVAPVSPTVNNGTVIYDPVANTWSAGPAALHNQDEVPWLKLPDGSLLCVDGASQSERYIPALNQWIADADTPVVLYSGGETGCGHMLANGKALFLGYTHTALYTPSGNNTPGAWVAGPDIPGGLNVGDTPGAVMVNGNVPFVAGPGYLTGPTSFFEYDAVANTMAQIDGPVGQILNTVPYGMKMLALPDGTVLVNTGGTLYEYAPAGAALAAEQPAITGIAHNADGSYHLTGTRLNGFSEGGAYGDDWQMATNYPLVRLTSNATGNVYFARTFNWSSTGVQTGATSVTTEFTLPPSLPAGVYSLAVVTNGIASASIAISTPFVPGDAAPTIATAAAAAPNVTTATTNLSVLGADADGGGEANLTYTWAITAAPVGVSTPSFSSNGTNTAKNTTATFHWAGNYTFTVTITDSSGLSVAGANVNVTVTQTLSSATVSAAGVTAANSIAVNITSGQTQQITATALDQFGNAMTAQPAFVWALPSGAGNVSATGRYTSPASGTLATVTATTGAFQATALIAVVSAPWTHVNINTPPLDGYSFDTGGTFTVFGNGSDIGGTADEFHYVYRTLNGDGIITARVSAQQNTNALAKAGVMIRETVAKDSVNAFMAVTPGVGTDFQARTATAGGTINNNTGGRVAPYWLRLVRSGDTLTGYSSANGSTWTVQSSATVPMAASVLAGLAVSSVDTTVLNSTLFDNVSIASLVANDDSITTLPSVPATINVVANDLAPSAGIVTVTAFTQGGKGSVADAGGGNLTYTPNANATGSDSFTYTISDGLGHVASATVSLVISTPWAYFKCQEGAGTATADASGNGFNAMLQGATWGSGVQGTNGLVFAGTSASYANIPALNLNSNTVTITAWVKRNGAQSSSAGIVFCRAGTTPASGLHFGTANELRYHWRDSASTYSYNSGLIVPDGQWTFVALVISPTNATLYMQPQGGAMQTATNTLGHSAAAFDGITTLGKDPGFTTRNFKGSMDEVRIYNASLTAANIATLANAAPTSAGALTVTQSAATGFPATLSALGASNIWPESNLTYTWAATGIPAGATAPTFTGNGTNAAKTLAANVYRSGSYTFQLTITDPSGGSVISSVNVTVNLKPFDDWRGAMFGTNATNPAIAGPLANPDSDGLSNLLEYALNVSPFTSSAAQVPTLAVEGANLTLTYRQNVSATDTTYTVQQSQDLITWSPANPTLTVLSDDGVTRVVKAAVPTGTAKRLMLRLSVTLN